LQVNGHFGFFSLICLLATYIGQVKSLEYKLKLRLEDMDVYQLRIHEQDREIGALKKKKEELKGEFLTQILFLSART